MGTQNKKRKSNGLHLEMKPDSKTFIYVDGKELVMTFHGKNGSDIYSFSFNGPRDFLILRHPKDEKPEHK